MMQEFVKKEMAELDRVDAQAFKQQEKFPLVLVLDQLRSGLNVGSFFRTADAMGIEAVYCIGYTPIPPHREILKTALGSTESVFWKHFESISDALEGLKSKGYRIIGLEQVHGSTFMDDVNEITEPTALVVGNEVSGVSEEAMKLCDACWEIRQFGTKHSMNVAVSGGMAIHHWVHLWRKGNGA
jgi:23S rRNA (guanosine2251-2'-O)-methyltransferase